MPNDAPSLKVAATKGYGGNVIHFDRYSEDWEAIANGLLAKDPNIRLIPPYDDPHVVAGQATIVKELIEEVGHLDKIFVPVGGGGVLAGSLLSARKLSPNCKLYGAEPFVSHAHQSMKAGKVVSISIPKSIADGVQTQHLGRLPFAIIKKHAEHIVTVSDEDIIEEMKFTGERLKMLCEPAGCLGLAALRKMAKMGLISHNDRVGIIVTGGNVDL